MMEKAKYWPSNWFQLKEDGVIIDERTPWNQGYRSVNGSLSYGGNAAGQESHMHLNQTLNIKRKNLINSVKSFLKKNEDDFNAKVAANREKRLARVDAMVMLVTAAPEQVCYQLGYDTETVNYTIDDLTAALNDGDDARRDTILANVKEWAVSSDGTFTPDADATKLLALLEAVEDELIEVTADSDLRRYL
jgi:hypothetical protein